VIAAVTLALSLVQGSRVEGAFVIRVDSEEVARESYTLASGRLASGQPGWTLSATARYDRVRPAQVLAPMIEIAQDSLPVTLQFDVVSAHEPVRVLGQLGRDRYTVRTVARSFERAREFPVQRPLVVLDDSVLTLYQIAAWFAGPRPVTITAIVARASRREQLVVTDAGSDSTAIGRRPSRLRHITVSGGANALVHLWLDDTGRVARIAIPSRRLVAERVPTD
jgi:hypothetical protein